jgi:hypothetical protein
LKEGEGKMRKMKFVFVLAVLATFALVAQAAYVTPPVTNGGFEQPGDGKHNAWDIEQNNKGNFLTDVPGWKSDITAKDSGVELANGDNTEGLYRGFLMGGRNEWSDPADWVEPSTWNITGYKIKADDQFALSLDAQNNWTNGTGPLMQVSLFYVAVGGARVTPDGWTWTIDLTNDWTTYVFDLSDASAGVGRLLGIELYNPYVKSSWLNVDDVKFIPEPATLILLGLGGLLLRRKR